MATILADRPAGSSMWMSGIRATFDNPLSIIGGIGCLILIAAAIFGPALAPHNPNQQELTAMLKAPEGLNSAHVLGTDNLGRDILSRIISGSRVSLLIAFAVVFVSGVIGITLGAISGYFGGKTDFMTAARAFISRYPQPGLALVVSDFLDDEDCEKPLQYMADFGHELMLLQVWSDEDRQPPWDGELEIEDAETGEHVELAFDAEARARYTTEFDAYADELERVALRNGGRAGAPARGRRVRGRSVHAG